MCNELGGAATRFILSITVAAAGVAAFVFKDEFRDTIEGDRECVTVSGYPCADGGDGEQQNPVKMP
jgi:hypothetical protein